MKIDFTYISADHLKITNIASHERKQIFMSIPKNASASIKDAIAKGWGIFPDDDVMRKEALRQDCRGQVPHLDKGWVRYWRDRGYFVFTVVRNPYARIVSGWYDKVWAPQKEEGDSEGIPVGLNFKDFLLYLRDRPVKDWNYHFLPQYCYLEYVNSKKNVKCLPELIVKLEELGRAWTKICRATNTPFPIPVETFNMRPDRQPWAHYCGREERMLIRDLYLRDFQLFYRKEPL